MNEVPLTYFCINVKWRTYVLPNNHQKGNTITQGPHFPFLSAAASRRRRLMSIAVKTLFPKSTDGRRTVRPVASQHGYGHDSATRGV